MRPSRFRLLAVLLGLMMASATPQSRADAMTQPQSLPTQSAPAQSVPAASEPEDAASAPVGRLRGEVSFSRQEPVVGANVILIREGDPGRLYLSVTDVHGYFRFESIPEGSWSLGVVRDDVVTEIKTGIRVRPPARAVVDIVARKGTARGDPPVFDLACYDQGPVEGSGTAVGRDDSSGAAEPAKGSAPSDGADGKPGLVVRVQDVEMNAVREARVSMRSRGPLVDPIRGVTDGNGVARSRAPEPGEYQFKVEVPGFLPARIDRLVVGRTPPVITAVLTPRPLDYPARPSELLPEEKPVPPEGFPGSRAGKPGA